MEVGADEEQETCVLESATREENGNTGIVEQCVNCLEETAMGGCNFHFHCLFEIFLGR